MTRPKLRESTGVALALLSAALWGLYPVAVHSGSANIPPLTFAASITIIAALGALAYALATGRAGELLRVRAYPALLMITLCIVIIPNSLFFIGARQTSGVNASFLLLSEIIFTVLFTPFIGEKTTRDKLLGAGGVFFGALFLLESGTWSFQGGDWLVILSTALFPLGNFYGKKALNLVSPAAILVFRFIVGGLVLSVLALVLERNADPVALARNYWPFLVVSGLVLLTVGKIIWYEALRRLDISKTVSLGMTFPLFSLAALVGFYREPVSPLQWAGIVVMGVGVYFSVRRPSVDPGLTRYAAPGRASLDS